MEKSAIKKEGIENYNKLTKTIVPQIKVRAEDLAAAIFYGLKHGLEFPLVCGTIYSRALAKWLILVSRAGHNDKQGQLNIQKAVRLLRTEVLKISERQWTERLKTFTFFGVGFSEAKFSVCKGPEHEYACGLWQLFHTLTVDSTDNNALYVLRGIRGYVDNFFSCEECREHFMSKDLPEVSETRQRAILWLWQAHNTVNKRIAPDWGYGPLDLQYPSIESCSDCRHVHQKNE